MICSPSDPGFSGAVASCIALAGLLSYGSFFAFLLVDAPERKDVKWWLGVSATLLVAVYSVLSVLLAANRVDSGLASSLYQLRVPLLPVVSGLWLAYCALLCTSELGRALRTSACVLAAASIVFPVIDLARVAAFIHVTGCQVTAGPVYPGMILYTTAALIVSFALLESALHVLRARTSPLPFHVVVMKLRLASLCFVVGLGAGGLVLPIFHDGDDSAVQVAFLIALVFLSAAVRRGNAFLGGRLHARGLLAQWRYWTPICATVVVSSALVVWLALPRGSVMVYAGVLFIVLSALRSVEAKTDEQLTAATANRLLSTVWAANPAPRQGQEVLRAEIRRFREQLAVDRLAIALSADLPDTPGLDVRLIADCALDAEDIDMPSPEAAPSVDLPDTGMLVLEGSAGWSLSIRLGAATDPLGNLLVGERLDKSALTAREIDLLKGLAMWITGHVRTLHFIQRRVDAERRLEEIARLRVADNYHAIANRFRASADLRMWLSQAREQCVAGNSVEAVRLVSACEKQFADFEAWYRRQNERYRRKGNTGVHGTLYRIEALAREFALDYGNRLDFDVDLDGDIDMPEPLPEQIAGLFEAIVEEAVRNAVKHAKASRVQVTGTRRRETATFMWEVVDNGSGIDSVLASIVSSGGTRNAAEERGGLSSFREELQEPPLNGTLTVSRIEAPGRAGFAHGTCVSCGPDSGRPRHRCVERRRVDRRLHSPASAAGQSAGSAWPSRPMKKESKRGGRYIPVNKTVFSERRKPGHA